MIKDIDDYKEIQELLLAKLLAEYPENPVEEGENWELIAKIFYKQGESDAIAKYNKRLMEALLIN